MTQFEEQLFKVLSRNDTGETGGHQSGISIPKNVASSSIFPKILIQDVKFPLQTKVEKNGIYSIYITMTNIMASLPVNVMTSFVLPVLMHIFASIILNQVTKYGLLLMKMVRDSSVFFVKVKSPDKHIRKKTDSLFLKLEVGQV